VRLIASIFIFGGVLALVVVFGRVVAPAALSTRIAVLKPKAGIPYGIAIAAGTLFMVMVSKPEAPSVYVPKGVTIQP
jgi:Flp pilus assembly protein protease CpaA